MRPHSHCKDRRFFTLIEVLVSFCLFSMLTSFLLLGLVQMMRMQNVLGESTRQTIALTSAYDLLKQSFAGTEWPEKEGLELEWTQERGPDRQPVFAGRVGRQLVLKEHALVLRTLALRGDFHPEREQFLLGPIENLRWEKNRGTEGWSLLLHFEWKGRPIFWCFGTKPTLHLHEGV